MVRSRPSDLKYPRSSARKKIPCGPWYFQFRTNLSLVGASVAVAKWSGSIRARAQLIAHKNVDRVLGAMTAPLLVDEIPRNQPLSLRQLRASNLPQEVAHQIGSAAQLMITDALSFSKGSLHRNARGDARVRQDASGMPASAVCSARGGFSRAYVTFRGAREIIEAVCQPVELPFAREISRSGPSRALVVYGGKRGRGVHGRNPAVEPQIIRLSCKTPSPERVLQRAESDKQRGGPLGADSL